MASHVHVGCTIKQLEDPGLRRAAAEHAIRINPNNRPRMDEIFDFLTQAVGVGAAEATQAIVPEMIAVLTTKRWPSSGVELSVSFMENTTAELQNKILSHMNSWYDRGANIKFRLTNGAGDVRISRGPGGYYSYLGTDIKQVSSGEQTMNLEGFTLKTPESEYKRVVRHETGHTLGFPHEHMRRQIIALLDVQKTIDYFKQFQGWSATTTRQQVLTPLEDASIMGTPDAEETSVMCYGFPASITVNNKAIPGGTDINDDDAAFAAKLYPKPAAPTQPPAGATMMTLDFDKKLITLPPGWAVKP